MQQLVAMGKKRLSITIDPALKDALTELKDSTGASETWHVERALREYLEKIEYFRPKLGVAISENGPEWRVLDRKGTISDLLQSDPAIDKDFDFGA